MMLQLPNPNGTIQVALVEIDDYTITRAMRLKILTVVLTGPWLAKVGIA